MRVARTETGLPHRNTVVLRHLKIYFQGFPGKDGSDAERGIADVEYTLRADGRVIDKSKTATDGLVNLLVPVGVPLELEIFGTKYPLKVHPYLEPVNQVK